MDVKPLDEIKENFKSGAAVVPARYVRGVKRAKWQEATKEGHDLWVQKISDPTVQARQLKGVEKVSDEQWRKDAEMKGGAVIGARIIASVDKQAANFAPFREVLAGLDLPLKTADIGTNVTNRVTAIAVALNKKKLEMMG